MVVLGGQIIGWTIGSFETPKAFLHNQPSWDDVKYIVCESKM